MKEDWGSPEFVHRLFEEWYETEAKRVVEPRNLRQREFAFLTFMGQTMYRHIGFKDVSALHDYLADNAPSHCYHSSTYYEDPQANMSEKGWLGADLVFDIDADHFDLECQDRHDRWRCTTCGRRGSGKPPERCECGKATFQTENWLCEKCLQAAKYEAQKLLDILIQDFGLLPEEEVICNFSGHRGYHVHVINERIKMLGQNERREIVDYIMGIGLEPIHLGYNRLRGGPSNLSEMGWRGRSGRALYDYILGADEGDIKDLSLGTNATETLLEKKEEILNSLMEKHPSQITQYLNPRPLNKLFKTAIKEQAAEIDTVVTTDIHRLIRIPNTLHGKTGWEVQNVPLDTLTDYNPLQEAIVFTEGTQKVYIKWTPRFKIGESEYGPYEDEKIELPTSAALFVLCKKGGRITNG
ncbi:MAG: DNA primase small subunit domain-containing protein [Candidatus Bathyarchaeia archaeon]